MYYGRNGKNITGITGHNNKNTYKSKELLWILIIRWHENIYEEFYNK